MQRHHGLAYFSQKKHSKPPLDSARCQPSALGHLYSIPEDGVFVRWEDWDEMLRWGFSWWTARAVWIYHDLCISSIKYHVMRHGMNWYGTGASWYDMPRFRSDIVEYDMIYPMLREYDRTWAGMRDDMRSGGLLCAIKYNQIYIGRWCSKIVFDWHFWSFAKRKRLVQSIPHLAKPCWEFHLRDLQSNRYGSGWPH